MKWKVHQDRDEEDPKIDSFTITLNEKKGGWNTDSGYAGYGLPKELVQWICDILNKYDENCPYDMNEYGYWEKKKKNLNKNIAC